MSFGSESCGLAVLAAAASALLLVPVPVPVVLLVPVVLVLVLEAGGSLRVFILRRRMRAVAVLLAVLVGPSWWRGGTVRERMAAER